MLLRPPVSPLHRRGLGDIEDIADAIQKIEGWKPGSLSYRLNNPGNLIYAGQPGATPVQVCNPACHQFASFPDFDSGYNALLRQINLDAARGLSISQFIAKYAPASDNNNPASYANTLARALGLSVDDALSAAISPASVSADTYTDENGPDQSAGVIAQIADVMGTDESTVQLTLVFAGLTALLTMLDVF